MKDTPVTESDIDEMGKDELATFALGQFGVELVKQKKIEKLRDEVKALLSGEKEQDAEEAAEDEPTYTHLKNPKTGQIFEVTDLLRKMTHLVPCDEKGRTRA